MQPLRVFYSPTQANRLVVGKLRSAMKVPVVFIPLSEGARTRKKELQEIEGRAVFIWGDGYRHKESYYFTRRSGARLKMVVDAHTDKLSDNPFDLDRVVFTFLSRFSFRPVTHGYHVSATAFDGMTTLTIPGTSKYSDLQDFLRRAKIHANNYGPNEIAATVDGDAILGFPAVRRWIYEDSLSPEVVIKFIRYLGLRLGRLDLGGLIESMPDFDFSGDGLLNPPTFGDALTYVENSGPANRHKLNGLADSVGSYVVAFYVALIDAFAPPVTESK